MAYENIVETQNPYPHPSDNPSGSGGGLPKPSREPFLVREISDLEHNINKLDDIVHVLNEKLSLISRPRTDQLEKLKVPTDPSTGIIVVDGLHEKNNRLKDIRFFIDDILSRLEI